MNGTIKIILGLIAGITLVCLILGISGLLLFQSTVETVVQASPVEVKFEEHAPEEIADYALPSGFGDKFTLQLGGYSLVGYTGDDGHSHIYLAQADASTGVTLDAIEGWIQKSAGSASESITDMHTVETVSGEIRGQQVDLVISEGTNHDGDVYRQVSGLFEGVHGPAVVVISGPEATWDQARVDAFIASIR